MTRKLKSMGHANILYPPELELPLMNGDKPSLSYSSKNALDCA
jgi:hypothetical protein